MVYSCFNAKTRSMGLLMICILYFLTVAGPDPGLVNRGFKITKRVRFVNLLEIF